MSLPIKRKVEEAITAFLKARQKAELILSGLAILAGRNDKEKTPPCVMVYAEGTRDADDFPSDTGVYAVSLKIFILNQADDGDVADQDDRHHGSGGAFSNRPISTSGSMRSTPSFHMPETPSPTSSSRGGLSSRPSTIPRFPRPFHQPLGRLDQPRPHRIHAHIIRHRPVNGRVEEWRGGFRSGLSVSASFVWRCLTSLTLPSVSTPRPSNRTCRFPASGSRTGFMRSHTAG